MHKIGYTTLQGCLSGRVKDYDHASGGKGKERVFPPKEIREIAFEHAEENGLEGFSEGKESARYK